MIIFTPVFVLMDYSPRLQITLKHLLLENKRMIGLKFYPNKVIQSLIKELPNPRWTDKYDMVYIKNSPDNLRLILDKFKGVAWVNCSYFFPNRPIKEGNEDLSVDGLRQRQLPQNYRRCPESYLQKLEIRKYSKHTARTYVTQFERFLNYYKHIDDPMQLGESEIRDFIQQLVASKLSDSYVNQSINAIKFYYEVVLGMPNRFYSIDRPRKKETLPQVLDQSEVEAMIGLTQNLKHKCIIELLYSAGLRRSELLDLKLSDIDSKRMLIRVCHGKGKKDRYTLLSHVLLADLRKYFITWRPKTYLFEGMAGSPYTGGSVLKIVKNAARKAKIRKPVTPHTLRHSFATHLLESGTDIRYIQSLLGHNSSRTTEIYAHVATNSFRKIQNPLDCISTKGIYHHHR